MGNTIVCNFSSNQTFPVSLKATDLAHWTIPQLTELKVQFLLEKCKVFFKVKQLGLDE